MEWDTCDTTPRSPRGGGVEKPYSPGILHCTLLGKGLLVFLLVQVGGTDDQQYQKKKKQAFIASI